MNAKDTRDQIKIFVEVAPCSVRCLRRIGKPDRSACSYIVLEQPTQTLVSTHSTETPVRTLTVSRFIVQPLVISDRDDNER